MRESDFIEALQDAVDQDNDDELRWLLCSHRFGNYFGLRFSCEARKI